jgi:histidyl-tRNA synthetase
MKLELVKGVRDWGSKDAILRNDIVSILRSVFESYGYPPLETPMLERLETISKKGGGEIQKEVFKLRDQGNRELALRFDQTLPFARYIATSGVKLPFKRHAIGQVFRDGPTQPDQGRYRIFTQCDVDVAGVADMTAEAELFGLAQEAFKRLGLGGVDVRVNNRKLLNGILDYVGIPNNARTGVIIALDKQDKIGISGVEKELRDLRPQVSIDVTEQTDPYLNADQVSKLLRTVEASSCNQETFSKLRDLLTSPSGIEGLSEIKTLLDYSSSLGYDFVHFDPTLARGLDYYTGTTIEVYLKDKAKIKSAILAGGRFDNMIGDFCDSPTCIPAVGFSFGLERLAMIVDSQKQTNTHIYLIPVGEVTKEALVVAKNIREQGLNVDMELRSGIKVGNSIKHAVSQGIPYVALVGENEIQDNSVTIKNLSNGSQKTVPLSQLKYSLN